MPDPLTCVGAIAGAFGVKGEVRIKSFCATPKDIALYSPFTTEDGKRQFNIAISRSIKNGFAGRIEGIDNREDVEALKGTRLYVHMSRLPKLPDDEFYHTDLIGLDVFDTGGEDRPPGRAFPRCQISKRPPNPTVASKSRSRPNRARSWRIGQSS